MNPYDWRRYPRTEIIRPNVEAVARDLLEGASKVLLAGRGLGKSVFLRQLRAELGRHDGVLCRLFSAPPAELTVRSCLEALARGLGVDAGDPLGTHELIEAYLGRHDVPRRVVLLYDEFDRYGRSGSSPAAPPGRDFFNNLESMLRDFPEVGVLATGGLGVFVFRDSLGSSFLARAERVRLGPFGSEDVRRLAQPFAEEDRPLSDQTLDAVGLATGGNPALVTYGFQGLWRSPSPSVGEVAEIFARFKRSCVEFLRDFQLSFSDPELSEAPQRIWELIQGADAPISHADLRKACVSPNGILSLSFADVLDLLEAAGLIHISGTVDADPVSVRPIASILTLPRTPSAAPGLGERFRHDLELLLARLHASGADFFRPGSGGEGKRLVPESVFATFLALGFDLLGWQVEREAQEGAGRTDLKLRWNGVGDLAVVELKIWGRGSYREAHRQLLSYWSRQVGAGAVVMLTDADVADWPELYRASCLAPLGIEPEVERTPSSPVRVRFRCTSTTPDDMTARIDHYLLRVPRGR